MLIIDSKAMTFISQCFENHITEGSKHESMAGWTVQPRFYGDALKGIRFGNVRE